MPAEFFFHAQAGREGLIDTAVKTSDTGYIQRRLMKTMEDLHVEYDGTVRNVQGTIIQIQYGEDGIDPIGVETQPYPVLVMTLEQIYAEFAYTAADMQPFVMETLGEAPDLLDEILKDREMVLRCAFHGKSQDIIQAPVHFGRLLGKYTNPYSVKSDLTPAYVVSEIGKLQAEFPQSKVFHALMRYNLAPKKSIITLRLTKMLFDELMREVRFKYIQALVHPGEMVGAVGAQSIGEPTTQLTLNTFHSAGTTNANATAGVPRMEELMGASKNPKRPGNTLYMLPEIQHSEKESQKKLKEIQKTTLRDITQFIRIYYDPYPTSGKTILPEDQAALDLYQQFSLNQNCARSPWVVRMQLDPAKLVERNLLDMTQIQTRIENNPVPAVAKLGDVMRMACTMITDAGQMAIRFEFEAAGTKTLELSMEFLRQCEEALLDTVVSGNPDIGRVYMRTIKDEPTLSPEVGGYVSKPFFVLDVEGANLMNLMSFPGIDATRCISNDIHEVNAVFGIEAARLAMFEEFNEVFSREKVNYHHLALLVDAMTVSGRIVPVNRFGMAKNETGVLAKS
jgi:DNA-directed RNA polymerase II subunit RPB1